MLPNEKAQKLKAAIKEIGIKYKGVEKLTGIPANSIQQYCSGRPIPEERLLIICEKLNIDSKIFGLDGRNFLQCEAI